MEDPVKDEHKVFLDDGKVKSKLFAARAIHFGLTLGLFFVAFLHFRYDGATIANDVGYRYNFIVTAGFGFCVYFFNRTYNSYLFGYSME